MALELKADDDDAKMGKERKLPSAYRLVIYQAAYADFQQKEDEFYAALPEGAERIDPQVARKLIEGAEVIDLRPGAFPGGPDPTSLPGAEAGASGTIDHRQKHPHVGKIESQVVQPQASNFEGFEPTSEATSPGPDHSQASDSEIGKPLAASTGAADAKQELGSGSQEEAAAGPAECFDERQKHPHVGKNGSQLVVAQASNFEGFEPTSEATSPGPDHPQVSDPGTGKPSPASTEAADPTPESGSGSQEEAAAGPAGQIDERQKHPHVGKNGSQLVLPQGPIFEGLKPASRILLPASLGSGFPTGVPPWPIWAKSAPLIPPYPCIPIQHAADLSTPDRPAVPPAMRGPRTPADLLKLVLSREGYFCAIPGCTNMAEFGHHIVFRVHGGTTTLIQLIGVCKECHDAGIHQGYLLVSGTAEKLIISGKGGLPLASGPDAFPPSVCAFPPRSPRGDGDLTPRLELPDPAVASPAIASPVGESQTANAVSFTIPAEISPAWWIEHRRYFEWSDRQKVLIARFDRESPECPATFEDRLPAVPRSHNLENFIGQKGTLVNLRHLIEAAKMRGEVPAPALLVGPPGLGRCLPPPPPPRGWAVYRSSPALR